MKKAGLAALTVLLKENNVELSAVRANKIMLQLGLMEEAERPSATKEGVIKKYKVLVGKGLDFGLNQENPQSPGQTSPYYQRETFEELAALLIEAKEAQDAS